MTHRIQPWEQGDERRLRFHTKSASHGSSTEQARRQVPASLKPLLSVLERQVLGQQVQPPNTAISVPMQQAISNLQSGGRGALPGGMSNLPNAGLQSRQQLGLPDRSSYFPGTPTFNEAAALGMFPPLQSNPKTQKTQKQEGTKPTKKQQRQQASPELNR